MFTIINYSLLTLFALVTLLPFIYVVIISFTDPTEYMTKSLVLIPETWSLSAYKFIFSTNSFLKAMAISGFLAIVGTLLSLIVTSALAYVLSRKRLKGKTFFLVMILLSMLFNAGMIPNYLLVDSLGLIDSVWALILPSLTSAWYVFLMKNFY